MKLQIQCFTAALLSLRFAVLGFTFTSPKSLLLGQSFRPTRTSLFEIDEKAVSDAVSWEPRKEVPPTPTPIKTPSVVIETTPEPPLILPSIEANVEPASVSTPLSESTPNSKSTSSSVSTTTPPQDPLPISFDFDNILPVAAVGGLLAAFAVGTFAMRGRSEVAEEPKISSTLSSVGVTDEVKGVILSPTSDIAVPYDAAARIAYDNWRATYNKGDFDEKRFQKFNSKYVSITSMNMAAKKVARDTSTSPELLEIPENADA